MSTNHRKRILLVARHPVGGILTFFRYIYRQEAFNEYDFTVAVPGNEQEESLQKIFANCEFVFLPCESSLDMIKKTWSYLRENNVSLVHSHGFSAGFLMVPVLMFHSLPHIVTSHDIFQNVHFAGASGRLIKYSFSLMFRFMDAIHTVGHEATDNLKEYFPRISRNKIHCIPNGIDTEVFFNAKSSEDNDELKKQGRYVIGFFGRFMSQKGFRDLVDAIDIITNEKMSGKMPIVLTYGWGGYIREEYLLIESRGLKHYFRQMPHTDDMPSALKSVDLVVMPSLWEAYPLLAMEALVAGVPIVGTDCIGLNEVLRGSPAARISPKDPRALAKAIAYEMNNEREHEFCKYASVAKRRFSLVQPSSELKKLYEALIS